MTAVPVPFPDAEAARRRLWTEFRIEAPVARWRDLSLLRVSVQAYNSPVDVDALLQAVRTMLSARGRLSGGRG
jgi:isopenicillin-N epimerase